MKYNIGWESNGKRHLYCGIISQVLPIRSVCRILPGTNFPGSLHSMDLAVFSHVMANWWENACISHGMTYTINGYLIRINHLYYGKSMNTKFPSSSHTMSFVAFCCIMGNWWENPCLSDMRKYTIGCESYEEKSSILWEKYEYLFSSFTPYDGFLWIFSYDGKLMGEAHAFPIWWSIR